MRPRANTAALALAVMCLVAGCRTVNTQVELSAEQYTVTAMMVELSQESMELLAGGSQPNVDTAVRRRDTRVTRFPTIHLLPDKTKAIDNQESCAYPLEFGADGKPSRYENVKTGQFISATLSLSAHGIPRLAISLDDSKLLKWKTFKSPTGDRHKLPLCSVRKFSTVVSPAWGRWEAVGREDGHVILVRLDQPTRQAAL